MTAGIIRNAIIARAPGKIYACLKSIGSNEFKLRQLAKMYGEIRRLQFHIHPILLRSLTRPDHTTSIWI